jgi:hypothetical protein
MSHATPASTKKRVISPGTSDPVAGPFLDPVGRGIGTGRAYRARVGSASRGHTLGPPFARVARASANAPAPAAREAHAAPIATSTHGHQPSGGDHAASVKNCHVRPSPTAYRRPLARRPSACAASVPAKTAAINTPTLPPGASPTRATTSSTAGSTAEIPGLVGEVGNPLLYVLLQRDNPTRYDVFQPGVVTSKPVQAEIVRDLEHARPGIVVRWLSPVASQPEPNGAGRSSGVRILDRWLARRYVQERRFGDYAVLRRRG